MNKKCEHDTWLHVLEVRINGCFVLDIQPSKQIRERANISALAIQDHDPVTVTVDENNDNENVHRLARVKQKCKRKQKRRQKQQSQQQQQLQECHKDDPKITVIEQIQWCLNALVQQASDETTVPPKRRTSHDALRQLLQMIPIQRSAIATTVKTAKTRKRMRKDVCDDPSDNTCLVVDCT